MLFRSKTFASVDLSIDAKVLEKDNVGEENQNGNKLHCPKCFSANVGMVSGCEEPTCFDCGYSKCS